MWQVLSQHKRGPDKMSKPSSPKRWAAVSILATSNSCEAARALMGKRILSAEAPLLPLAQCTQRAICSCKYAKHADRRAGPRRTGEDQGWRRPTPKVDTNQSAGRGRRKTDQIY